MSKKFEYKLEFSLGSQEKNEILLKVLEVDKEIKPDVISRNFELGKEKIKMYVGSDEIGPLMSTVRGVMNSVVLVCETINKFSN